MTRPFALALPLALLLSIAGPRDVGAAVIEATLYPGLTIPSGDFANDELGEAENGPRLGVALDAWLLSDRLAAGVEVAWTRNNTSFEGETEDVGGGFYIRANEEQYEILQFGGRARYVLPFDSPRFRPYALIGAGVYDLELHWEYATGGPFPTQEIVQSGQDDLGSNFGGRAGLGFEYEASPAVVLGLGADYHLISTDEADTGSSSIEFWGIQLSIGHRFGP